MYELNELGKKYKINKKYGGGGSATLYSDTPEHLDEIINVVINSGYIVENRECNSVICPFENLKSELNN